MGQYNPKTHDECQAHRKYITKACALAWARDGKGSLDGHIIEADGRSFGVLTVYSSQTCRGYVTHYRDREWDGVRLAMTTLRAIPSERRTQASRTNGAKGDPESHRRSPGRPRKA